MSNIKITTINTMMNEVVVDLEGDDIIVDNGHLVVDDVNGDIIAVVAPGKWSHAVKIESKLDKVSK